MPLTSLNTDKWEELLLLFNYFDLDVVHHLRHGWPINFIKASKLPGSQGRNHKGAIDFEEYVDGWLNTETKLGRIRGPFATPPLDNFVTSPLNTVPKSGSVERRVIVDLSWPSGEGVNDGIDINLHCGESMKLIF